MILTLQNGAEFSVLAVVYTVALYLKKTVEPLKKIRYLTLLIKDPHIKRTFTYRTCMCTHAHMHT